MKTNEEIRELLKEEILRKDNLNKEIAINEGMQFKVEIAIACDLNESMYSAQVVVYNGRAQYDSNKDNSLMGIEYFINSIDFDLNKIGLDLSNVSLTIYKFDFFEGVNKLTPIFDNPMINSEETNRELVNPRTLDESRDQIMLFIVGKLLEENKEKYQLSEDFIEKFNNDFDGFYYGNTLDNTYKYFLDLTDQEVEFLEMCYDIVQDITIEGYKYNDPILGELIIREYSHEFYEYILIKVEENKDRLRSIKIPFKVFGDRLAIKLGTIKTK